MVRIMIVLLLVGSCVLGWLAYKQQQRLEYLRTALAEGGIVASSVGMIQRHAADYTSYKDNVAREKFRGDDPQEYITAIAYDPAVYIGRVDIGMSNPQSVIPGSEDRTYRIDPSDRKATFGRLNIANFLHKLEEDSRRVKVTMVDLKAAGNPGDDEVPVDSWEMAVGITIREKKSKSATGR